MIHVKPCANPSTYHHFYTRTLTHENGILSVSQAFCSHLVTSHLSTCQHRTIPFLSHSQLYHTMDLPPQAWSETCVCGRIFFAPQAYTYHKGHCPKSKKRLSWALEKAREVWKVNKHYKLEVNPAAAKLSLDGPLPGIHGQVSFLA